jgi:hypothetical protein
VGFEAPGRPGLEVRMNDRFWIFDFRFWIGLYALTPALSHQNGRGGFDPKCNPIGIFALTLARFAGEGRVRA